MNIYGFKITDINKSLFLPDTSISIHSKWVRYMKGAGCTLCRNYNKNMLLSSLSIV